MLLNKRYFSLLCIVFFFVSGCSHLGAKAPAEKSTREIYATDLSFDVSTGEIRYTLAQDALVRIRIGIKEGGPLLRHLLDWEYRKAGSHVEVWDFKNALGNVTFGQRADYMIVLAALSPRDHSTKAYAGQIQGLRVSPVLNIEFPDSKKSESGIPVVSGIASVRVSINDEDLLWLRETKYEVGLFIDNVFLFEDEEGISPFTYSLDTSRLNKGRHILTVNIIGYEGEIGTKTVPVFVKN